MKKIATFMVALVSLSARIEALPKASLECPDPTDIKKTLDESADDLKKKMHQQIALPSNRSQTPGSIAGAVEKAVRSGTLTFSYEGKAIHGIKTPINGACPYTIEGQLTPFVTFQYH
ncbi:MAG: hypothetical protein H0X26_05935 [Alphaproteobacteria bacterium]|nr:hypothetical protein [Alphaproteobacteria bacterium]